MFISFLRENGRWSLYHRVVKEENGVAICVCGWEYDASLTRTVGAPELGMLICANCADGVPATQDVLRVGGHLTQRGADLSNADPISRSWDTPEEDEAWANL